MGPKSRRALSDDERARLLARQAGPEPLPPRVPGAMLAWVEGRGPYPYGPEPRPALSPGGTEELDQVLLELFGHRRRPESELSRRVRRWAGYLLAEFRALWLAWGLGPGKVQERQRALADRVTAAGADLRAVRDRYPGLLADVDLSAGDGLARRAEELAAIADRQGRRFVYSVRHALCTHAPGAKCDGSTALTGGNLLELALEHCYRGDLERRFPRAGEDELAAGGGIDRVKLTKRLTAEAALGAKREQTCGATGAPAPGARR